MTDERDFPEEVPDADIDLCKRLQAVGCVGPTWEFVGNELWRYGWSVLSAWLSSGWIGQKCSEKGRWVQLPVDWTAEDREDLVVETLLNGLETFRQGLLNDRWQPERGASLKTYYLGGCILAFPNAFRRWRNDRDRYRRAAGAAAREVTGWRMGVDPVEIVNPVDVVDAIDALRSLTRGESGRARAIRLLCFYDYTPIEIAEILTMTPGAVNAALSRMRRRQGGEGGGRGQ